jgi:hypothetical protein
MQGIAATAMEICWLQQQQHRGNSRIDCRMVAENGGGNYARRAAVDVQKGRIRADPAVIRVNPWSFWKTPATHRRFEARS